jgi:hypothetical protein
MDTMSDCQCTVHANLGDILAAGPLVGRQSVNLAQVSMSAGVLSPGSQHKYFRTCSLQFPSTKDYIKP